MSLYLVGLMLKILVGGALLLLRHSALSEDVLGCPTSCLEIQGILSRNTLLCTGHPSTINIK